jgi:hypothetical protein
MTVLVIFSAVAERAASDREVVRVGEWLAVASLVISLVSLVISTKAYRRAGPRLIVSVWKSVKVGRGEPERIFFVVVHNIGHGAITIRDAGLLADAPSPGRISGRQIRETGVQVNGPELPYRVEGNGFGEWAFDGRLAAKALGATTKVFGYVEVARIGDSKWRRWLARSARRTSYTTVTSKWSEYNATP